MLTNWKFWVVVFIVLFVLIYLIFGGKKHEVVGLKPLQAALGGDITLDGHDVKYYKDYIEPFDYPSHHEYEDDNIKEDDNNLFTIVPRSSEVLTFNNYKSKGEEMACRALHRITGLDVKVGYRQANILNPKTGRQLEIDCFADGIGVEYDGIQHYVYPNPFHKTEKEFKDQVDRDNFKERECLKKGIFLIRVPYTIDTYKQTANGPKKARFTLNERYSRVYDYIHHTISRANEGLHSGVHYTTHYIP